MYQDVKDLIKKGLEISILNNEKESKNIFFELLSKLEKIEQNENIKICQNIEKNSMTYTEDKIHLNKYDKLEENLKRDMCMVANYFSLYEHKDLYPAFSQDKAFEIASQILHVKKRTLKSTRDMFDGHNNSHRIGWQKELSPLLQEVKTNCERITREEFLTKVKQILKIN